MKSNFWLTLVSNPFSRWQSAHLGKQPVYQTTAYSSRLQYSRLVSTRPKLLQRELGLVLPALTDLPGDRPTWLSPCWHQAAARPIAVASAHWQVFLAVFWGRWQLTGILRHRTSLELHARERTRISILSRHFSFGVLLPDPVHSPLRRHCTHLPASHRGWQEGGDWIFSWNS